MVAEFDHGLLKDDTIYPYVVQCEQFKLTRILTDLTIPLTDADICFSHRVTAVTCWEDSVAIEVATPKGIEQHRGRYLIGSDGGRSTVLNQD